VHPPAKRQGPTGAQVRAGPDEEGAHGLQFRLSRTKRGVPAGASIGLSLVTQFLLLYFSYAAPSDFLYRVKKMDKTLKTNCNTE